MCVQTGGGSDVVVKNNPNILKYERQWWMAKKVLLRHFQTNWRK